MTKSLAIAEALAEEQPRSAHEKFSFPKCALMDKPTGKGIPKPSTG